MPALSPIVRVAGCITTVVLVLFGSCDAARAPCLTPSPGTAPANTVKGQIDRVSLSPAGPGSAVSDHLVVSAWSYADGLQTATFQWAAAGPECKVTCRADTLACYPRGALSLPASPGGRARYDLSLPISELHTCGFKKGQAGTYTNTLCAAFLHDECSSGAFSFVPTPSESSACFNVQLEVPAGAITAEAAAVEP